MSPRAKRTLYCLETDGKITKKIESTTISNGLVWSSDATTFWWIDSPEVRPRG